MTILGILTAVGVFLGGTAAWGALWSPRAKEARRRRAMREQREREVHEALFGIPARFDDAGALISDPEQGLCADMRFVKAKLGAPLLNGKGDDLITTVARLDRRTLRQGKQIGSIEKWMAGRS